MDIKSKEFYEFYAINHFKRYTATSTKKGIINRNSKYFLEYKEFNDLLTDLNIGLRNLIIEQSFEFNIPYRMGILSIRKNKPEPYIDNEGNLVNTLPVDWKATKELWANDEQAKEKKTLVRHLNKHSQGYVMRWKYDLSTANYKNKSVYRFVPCRDAKRMITPTVKDQNNKIDYYLV